MPAWSGAAPRRAGPVGKEPDVIFRKARPSHTTADLDAADRRRRSLLPEGETPTWLGDPPGDSGSGSPTPVRPPGAPAHLGPYDADEVESGDDPAAAGRIDLGGLQIPRVAGIEVRMLIDQASQVVVAALLAQGDSVLELRAFAAPRSTGLWDENRHEIAAEATRAGGMVTEANGPFGLELKVVVPTQTAGGHQATHTKRFVGVDHPRWFLRGTLNGPAASDPHVAGPLLAAMSEVVVVRGKSPMVPRDMIPLKHADAPRAASPYDGH